MVALNTPDEAVAWLKSRVTGDLRTDSRKVRAGDGFVAWPGTANDSRQHVNSAVESGAVACLVERADVERYHFADSFVASYPQLQPATGLIAAAYYGHPTQTLDIVAVTGTNGKTSTAWWLAHALSSAGAAASWPCGFVGTLGIGHFGKALHADVTLSRLTPSGLTTPDPVLLQSEFSRMLSSGLKVCAIEASSIGIVESRLNGTRIRVAVFTNFTLDHLDYHGSMQAYWEAKAMLFRWPGLRAAVINIDDDKGLELAGSLAASNSDGLDIWTTSSRVNARLRAQDITYDTMGLKFVVVEGGTHIPVQTRLIGHYNVDNLLGVIGAMRAIGVPLDACVASSGHLQPVPGRMECHGGEGTPLVAVDYAHTPDALEKALTALRPLARQRGGKVWCVFGCGGDRDASKRPVMGAIAGQHADHLIVTSDNPRTEDPLEIIKQVMQGIVRAGAVEVEVDRARAIERALCSAAPNDVVLVAGKGHEDYQDMGGIKRPFSDRDHVQKSLSMLAECLATSKGIAA